MQARVCRRDRGLVKAIVPGEVGAGEMVTLCEGGGRPGQGAVVSEGVDTARRVPVELVTAPSFPLRLSRWTQPFPRLLLE